MAIREKTVTFAFPMTTTLVADATVTNLDQITVYIPEASPTFTSVFVEVGFQDVATSGATITEHRVSLRLGAADYTTFVDTNDIAHTSEGIAGVGGPIDFTSHFNANWTGLSMTCDAQVYFDQSTGATLGMANVTALIYVTYQYDDTASTQIKTVHIPMESRTTSLPTVATNFGTSQIPQLTGVGGILCEASPVVRDWFIVIEGNEFNNGTSTDFTISVNIDGGAATSFMTQEAALASDRFCRWVYRPEVPTLNNAHNLQLWATVAKAHHVTVTLVVTYEFNLLGTTRVLNSIRIPVEIASPLGASIAELGSRFRRDILITEPGEIMLRQSGFRINYNLGVSPGFHGWRAGSQAFRVYSTGSNVMCGMCSVQHRIDAGAAGGAGIDLVRGRNTLTIDGYGGSATQEMTNINGYVLLNYESDLAAGGIGQHNHTIWRTSHEWSALLRDFLFVVDFSFPIHEPSYNIASVGFCLTSWLSANSAAITLDVECLSSEGKGDGYYDIYSDAYVSDAERACNMIWMRGRDVFRRFPNDADPERLDLEIARRMRIFTTSASASGLLAVVTYHSMTWSIAGNLTEGDDALPTEVKLHRADSGEVMQRQTLSAGVTSYSFTVYDDTEEYYVTAEQDAAHVGRSATGTAS